MAVMGTAYFDASGQFFKSADEATISDLSGVLGKVGEGDSLAPGIARILLQKRAEIEEIFKQHDVMIDQHKPNVDTTNRLGESTKIRMIA